MSTWTMEWGDGSERDDPPLPPSAWEPRPVAAGSVLAVRAVIHGFHGLPEEPLLVAWDDRRATVRLATGELRWYQDGRRQAYRAGDEIVVEEGAVRVYPRGNRYMDALVVRSLEDLVETVNADEVTSIDEDGTIHIRGEHDDSRGEVVRTPDTGIILRASGVVGTSPWHLSVLATRLLEGDHGLLEPADVTPPPI
ncbi:hypothetical protein [Nocardioides dongxiaopingii]|uniref:hypothetical protein n=1 Tax=Nocardioides dongxiaopingii TaxID=2576036 RepID=UPI0010C76192|nr:hypothetical protein [Nocardioides dongxiaopingii]